MSVDFETAVIGGGIIGLATADACTWGSSDVLLIERHARLGQETTARNSEVVHAGLYYPPGSLKARLSVEGRNRLQSFCTDAGVPYALLGKLVVACDPSEIPALEALAANARANGVMDAHLLTGPDAETMEPGLACVAALHSPSTAVVDSTGVMLALEARFIDRGGTVATGTSAVAIDREPHRFRIVTVSHGCEASITCRNLVLAGGLHATALAKLVTPPLAAPIPQTHFAKGHYYALSGKAPFSRLIYPMPSSAGLGIHFTLTTAGEAKFGPDVAWVDEPSTTFDDPDGARRLAFAEAIRRYWPALDETHLTPAYVGVRPKLARAGAPAQDFLIADAKQHGCENLIALYGIESPGLTSALAIGNRIAARLAGTTV
ncbi:MAG: FAD-dependent oxidoreductase [Hyphomicrobium sp.]|nr:FAD-dependent oxidoreductase [Hyphomicrobium sp.]PPD06763.1 MAG: FAD-dependent oxidoreductase [Hyphomicrobium sp.]